MALERKDVRVKFDADKHTTLAGVAEADAMDIGEWVETLVNQEVARRVHAARVIIDAVERAGINGKNRE